MKYDLIHGNCLDEMQKMNENSVDSIVTDPPYGLSFMGKNWDHGVPGEPFWKEALRIAKPGAHLLAFGGTRTFHRLAVAIEDAGWEIRDTIMWVYGSGFPKSHNVSLAIDKKHGAVNHRGKDFRTAGAGDRKDIQSANGKAGMTYDKPVTDAARQWNGWGTALKPAWEPIIVARKPVEGTVAQNVLKHGTGAINVDGCRVGVSKKTPYGHNPAGKSIHADSWLKKHGHGSGYGPRTQEQSGMNPNIGRFPANLIHDGSDDVVQLFPVTNNVSAARFFYCTKTSKQDRDEGLEEFKEMPSYMVENGSKTAGTKTGVRYDRTTMQRNHHPTVKPTDLMRYLCRLVTPPGGTVLDPFMGSGSTGKAAIYENKNFIGIEMEQEYIDIAKARIEYAKKHKKKTLEGFFE